MKKILTVAVAAALAAPMAAMADATIYGTISQALENVDNGTADAWFVQDYYSRVGVKGSEDLGNGLKAIYKVEWGVNIAGSAGNYNAAVGGPVVGQGSLSGRNAYVGLAGGFGTFLAGRHDTPLKISTGSLDYFANTAGDYNLVGNLNNFDEERVNGTLAYVSPSMGGLTIAAAIVPGEMPGAVDGLADAYSIAGMYSNGGIYAAVAMTTLDANGPEDTRTRFGLGYDAGNWKVGGVWQNTDDEVGILNSGLGAAATPTPINDRDAWMINAAMNFGNNTVKAKYWSSEDDSNNEEDGWALGLDHNLSKRTKAYALYADSEVDNSTTEEQIFAVGLEHSF